MLLFLWFSFVSSIEACKQQIPCCWVFFITFLRLLHKEENKDNCQFYEIFYKHLALNIHFHLTHLQPAFPDSAVKLPSSESQIFHHSQDPCSKVPLHYSRSTSTYISQNAMFFKEKKKCSFISSIADHIKSKQTKLFTHPRISCPTVTEESSKPMT